MKVLLIAMFVAMASLGCSKHEVYERNLQYMTVETFEAEKTVAARQLQQAQTALDQAQASGDPERIRKAKARFDVANGRYKGILTEERRRNRTW